MRTKFKKVIQYSGESFIAILVFILVLFLLPSEHNKTESVVNTQSDTMQFILHGSADEWENFFVEQGLNELLSQEESEILLNMLVEDEKLAGKGGNTSEEKSFDKIIKENKSCMLPWHDKIIEDGEDTLAYKQRSDVPSLCHVERRVCHNGILEGSFTQSSCSENVAYAYTKGEVILYNPDVTNPYIQTDTRAKYYDADFNLQGQRNKPLIPIDIWNNRINDMKQMEVSNTKQSQIIYANCETPRGEYVEHTHFVKAYKNPYGFNNRACKVELRFCIDGVLGGTYDEINCKHKDMVWQDYNYKSESDEKPTILNLIDSLR